MSCPPQTTIARGQRFQVYLDWKNIGTVDYAFDLLLLIMPPGETKYYLMTSPLLDQSLAAGQSKSTMLFDGNFTDAAPTGLYKIAALICDFDSATGQIITQYALLECPDSIKVT
jgi:hypothetical protein